LIDFCDLLLQRTFKNELEIGWQFANRNCYRFSRVLWASVQISCYGVVIMALLLHDSTWFIWRI